MSATSTHVERMPNSPEEVLSSRNGDVNEGLAPGNDKQEIVMSFNPDGGPDLKNVENPLSQNNVPISLTNNATEPFVRELSFILHMSKQSLQLYGNDLAQNESIDPVSLTNITNLRQFCLLIVRDAYGIKKLADYDIRISFGKYYDDILGFVMLERQEQISKIFDKKLNQDGEEFLNIEV